MTSDAKGVASWQDPPTAAISSKVFLPGTELIFPDGAFANFSQVNTAEAVLIGMTIGILTPNPASLYAPITCLIVL